MKKLLFFQAPWCTPCQFYDREVITPLEQTVGADRITRVNAQNDPFMAEKYGIDKLPTIIILDGNKRILQSTGGYTIEQLLEFLEELKGGDPNISQLQGKQHKEGGDCID